MGLVKLHEEQFVSACVYRQRRVIGTRRECEMHLNMMAIRYRSMMTCRTAHAVGCVKCEYTGKIGLVPCKWAKELLEEST